ncbi:hypothetical protein CWI37_0136p0020 [Hamiltosporidium tvaerminnensis]|uniref:Uncharacterized protein n=1 Tax=Hamiltosporidium tvaerminnensis TaxID=1176355 RepID=A0A4Q9L9M0_9MICR|nr:hypothetical protein CWI37_0136p0020 [Hamiltosporidium tvaerminnensis]
MFLKLFLILVLGYHKSIIQATSDREELLSKDEIENDNVAIEEYLWNQLTDFSRNCLKKAIEKRHIKSKNFLLSMQTSFDKFNGQKRFFDASLENNFYFILYFKISENFDLKIIILQFIKQPINLINILNTIEKKIKFKLNCGFQVFRKILTDFFLKKDARK